MGEEDDKDVLKRTIQCSIRGEYREEGSPSQPKIQSSCGSGGGL